MTASEPNGPDELRETDDRIAEDTLILREIEREFRELEPDHPQRPTLGSAATSTAAELRHEAGEAVELARKVADAD